jgi:hypothetical protein
VAILANEWKSSVIWSPREIKQELSPTTATTTATSSTAPVSGYGSFRGMSYDTSDRKDALYLGHTLPCYHIKCIPWDY